MAARRKNKKNRYMLALAGFGVLFAIDTLIFTMHIIGWLIITAVIGAAAWFAGRFSAPGTLQSRELAETRAELTKTRAELADAKTSAAAAWDAAAERPPSPARQIAASPQRDKLLSDPRSGARPLGNTG